MDMEDLKSCKAAVGFASDAAAMLPPRAVFGNVNDFLGLSSFNWRQKLMNLQG